MEQSVDLVYQSRRLMVQALSQENPDESQLDDFNSRGAIIINNVLEMITGYLFDDPGIFYVHLVYDKQERTIQEAVNMWLINHVVYLTTITEHERYNFSLDKSGSLVFSFVPKIQIIHNYHTTYIFSSIQLKIEYLAVAEKNVSFQFCEATMVL